MSEAVTMTLTEFLLARIGEDEDAARLATSPPWEGTCYDDERELFALTTHGYPADPKIIWATEPSDTDHIVRHDPARVIAECEAKRQIVKWCVAGVSQGPWPMRAAPYVPDYYGPLRFLASVYADHPDYRPEWKP